MIDSIEEGHSSWISAVAWSCNKKQPLLITGGHDNIIKIWKINQNAKKIETTTLTMKEHKSRIKFIQARVSHDNNML